MTFVGWQADSNPRPGELPGRGEGCPAPLAGFGHDGAWAGEPPSAGLAVALEAAAGPEGLYDGADTDALVGIAAQWAAVESWAAAGKLGALRAMMREDGEGTPLLRRRGDLPEGWDDALTYEVAGALAVGPVSAGNLAGLAWTLGARLPGIGRLLADGTLTLAKAKLVVAVFEPLSDDEAARAEALIVGEVAGKTYFQVERLAWRAALAVAPDVAERRRTKAERERARVTVFREESGAVGLSGRDLPAAQALAGHASVLARAKEYEASGAFCGQSTSGLEALAYLHLLNGVSVGDAMETRFTPVSIDANLAQAVDALLATAQHEFPVVDAFGKPVGLLTRDDILTAVREHGGEEPAAKFMRSGVESVRATEPVQGLFERLQDPGAAALYVTDADGKIIGLLTRHALAEVMMIRAARPDWRFDRKA